jgi:DNA-binding protein Fis
MGALTALPALDIRPSAAQPDPLEQYGRLLQLKQQQQMAPLQQQQAQQSLQSGAVQLQQQQQALKDQQASTQALTQWDGKDINDLYPLILKNGGSASAVFSLKKQALDQQHTAAETMKNQADAGKAQVETVKQRQDLVNGALSPLVDPKQIPDEQLPQTLQSTVQDLVSKQLLDPQHAQAAQAIAQSGDPVKIRAGVDQFIKTNMAQTQLLEEAHKTVLDQQETARAAQANAEAAKIKASTDPTSPLYAPSQAAVAMGTAPGAAQIKAGEAQQAGAKAGAEERARMPGEMALAAQKQALSQGDPAAAAQLLVQGDATLSELKSRGATPDFIARTLFAANRLSGGKYNAQSADANFQVAKSPANVGFFGSAKSLTDKGGTLDQLAQAAKDIPDGQIPVFNSLADAVKAAAGSGPIAKYASLMVGASDDYSKVMGGGTGSDSSRAQALNLIPAKASPEARAAAIEGIRGAVGSQINSRIGNNPVLKRMYGDAATPTSGAAPAPSTHTFSLSAWQKANPKGDPAAAKAAAAQAGYQVVQ